MTLAFLRKLSTYMFLIKAGPYRYVRDDIECAAITPGSFRAELRSPAEVEFFRQESRSRIARYKCLLTEKDRLIEVVVYDAWANTFVFLPMQYYFLFHLIVCILIAVGALMLGEEFALPLVGILLLFAAGAYILLGAVHCVWNACAGVVGRKRLQQLSHDACVEVLCRQ